MAKILVADDNSNVQKTVVLALSDLGVDIVSVNNGEAAVRKLADFSPDLILADIFMPVRNGYEVCEYVKKDAQFSRVPVVLLVGAFDPLDEREAQRVGADGILKKPFVPPDPLITMVKMLLERTMGERLVAVSAPKPAAFTVPSRSSAKAVPSSSPQTEISEDTSSPEFPPPLERVAFGDGDRPVAFGQMLETPVQDAAPETAVVEPVKDEQILTSQRPATLGDPVFWRNESPDQDAEAVTPESGSEPPLWTPEGELRQDEPMLLQAVEPLELIRDEQDEASPSVVDNERIELDAAAQAPLTVDSEKPSDLAANPLEWMATVPAELSSEAYRPSLGQKNSTLDEPEAIDPIEAAVHPLGMAPVSSELSIEGLSSKSVPAAIQPDAAIVKVLPESPAAEIETAPISNSDSTSESHSQLESNSDVLSQRATETARSIPRDEWAELASRLESSPSASPESPAEHTQTIVPSQAPESVLETAGAIARENWQEPSAGPQSSLEAPPLPPAANSQPEVAPSEPTPAVSETESAPLIRRHNWAELDAVIEASLPAALQHSSASVPQSEILPSEPAPSPTEVAHSIHREESTARSASVESVSLATIQPPDLIAQPEAAPVESSQSDAGAGQVSLNPAEPLVASVQLAVESGSSDSDAHQSGAETAPPAAELAVTTAEQLSAPTAGSLRISSPDPALVEAVVQRVLDKMRPQVVDIITKEFLRPIVQALVNREIEKQ